MVKLVDNSLDELLKFCKKDAFGTRIAASQKAYSGVENSSLFWIQTDEEGLTAVISRIEGIITVCLDIDNADCEELKSFIDTIGYKSIVSDYRFFIKAGIGPTKIGAVVEFKSIIGHKNPVNISISQSDDYKKAYSMLKLCGFDDIGDYQSWLADISLRARRNTAQLYFAEYNNQICASASVLFLTETAAFMGGICTLPEFRGKGIAKSLVSKTANLYAIHNKSVSLFCKDELVDFYKRCGFEKTVSWAIKNNGELK